MTSNLYRRILVAWDATPAARAALRTATTMAAGKGIIYVRAVPTVTAHTETGGEERRDLRAQQDYLRAEFEAALVAASDVPVRFEWGETDDVAEDICAAAERHGCDLLILGRQEDGGGGAGQTGARQTLAAVVEHAAVPVLIIPALRDQ
ncbi:universal stress protein [Streptomyces sp. NPDC047046]|uniref:universal stress protein n=1 Tax=Streptomyces sp. NPDC047046 TaxID=3155378 RepID=UPI0033C7819F